MRNLLSGGLYRANRFFWGWLPGIASIAVFLGDGLRVGCIVQADDMSRGLVIGRTEVEQIPELPPEVVQQLPGACLDTWHAETAGEHGTGQTAGPFSNSTPPQADPADARWRAFYLRQVAASIGQTGKANLGSGHDDDDPLADMGAAAPIKNRPPSGGMQNLHPQTSRRSQGPSVHRAGGADPHEELLANDPYPSALTCAKCHPKHFAEWRSSAHAYASISPMFQRFEQKIIDLTQGTVGAFCFRCHAPVAVQLNLPRSTNLLDAPAIVREGITCIACHRVNEWYSRTNGSRRIEPGNVYEPVYGSGDGTGVAAAITQKDEWKLKLSPTEKGPGQPMHRAAFAFQPLSQSDFCAPCHQVAVHPGIGLEIVDAQYLASPAAAKGITCQDCHMGQVPGKPDGYEFTQIAELSGKPWGEVRKHANHSFWGPGFSIAHPGLFPLNEKAEQWTPRQWLEFDYRSAWGTEAFERQLPAGAAFPPTWQHADDRRDARKIIAANLEVKRQKRADSIRLMELSSDLIGPKFDHHPQRGAPLKFRYLVRNLSEGHNLPTGSLGAQPQIWLNVVLIGPDGQRLWESGYLDRQGDLADLMSEEMHQGKIARDSQLFSLQTKFLINSFRGTDREVAVPLNFSFDQLVFLRPGAVPVSVLNHPPLIRMEARSIPALGQRQAVYTVPGKLLTQPGVYRLSARMRSRVEPMYFMRLVDATPDMMQRMDEGTLNFHTQSYSFIVR